MSLAQPFMDWGDFICLWRQILFSVLNGSLQRITCSNYLLIVDKNRTLSVLFK